MYLDKSQITDQLLEFAGQSNRPIIIHSDLLKVGLFERLRSSDAFLNDHYEVLSTLAKKRPLLLPSFNYEFCKTGIYDVHNSRSQVGAFADFLRKKECARTHTPIFNFCMMGDIKTDYIPPCQNVFGEASVFARVAKEDGDVLLYGADYIANTFIHYAEELVNVGYRYLKTFSGKIINGAEETPVQVEYRVRPRGLNSFVYDREKEKADLVSAGVLKIKNIGKSEALLFNTNKYIALMTEKLKSDELVYLTADAKSEVLMAKSIHGYPFKFKSFEENL